MVSARVCASEAGGKSKWIQQRNKSAGAVDIVGVRSRGADQRIQPGNSGSIIGQVSEREAAARYGNRVGLGGRCCGEPNQQGGKCQAAFSEQTHFRTPNSQAPFGPRGFRPKPTQLRWRRLQNKNCNEGKAIIRRLFQKSLSWRRGEGERTR